MLRESVDTLGEALDFKIVTEGGDESGIPHAGLLTRFAEAVVTGGPEAIANNREMLSDALGDAAMIDAAAVVAAFHGFVRVADATGVPVEDARLLDTAEVRSKIGIDAFR